MGETERGGEQLEEGVAHHGAPILTERDVCLCQAMSLWIHTARTSGNAWYKDWLPSYPDILKSRLFWRIRSGKKPLEHRPPTAYSCPWYELIDEPERAHWAYDCHQHDGRVSFAQCSYDVVERDAFGVPCVVSFGPWQFKCWQGPDPHGGTHTGWWLQIIAPGSSQSGQGG